MSVLSRPLFTTKSLHNSPPVPCLCLHWTNFLIHSTNCSSLHWSRTSTLFCYFDSFCRLIACNHGFKAAIILGNSRGFSITPQLSPFSRTVQKRRSVSVFPKATLRPTPSPLISCNSFNTLRCKFNGLISYFIKLEVLFIALLDDSEGRSVYSGKGAPQIRHARTSTAEDSRKQHGMMSMNTVVREHPEKWLRKLSL